MQNNTTEQSSSVSKKGNIRDQSTVSNLEKLSKYVAASPFPDSDVSFNWMMCAYPYLHYHDYFEILVVIDKELINDINGTSYIMKKGDACFIRPADQHRLLASSRENIGQQLNFLLTYDYAKKLIENYRPGLTDELLALPEPLNFKISPEYLVKLTNSCLSIQSTKLPYEAKILQCKIIITRLLNTFLEKHFALLSSYPEWFSALLQRLNDPHSEFTVEELARTTSYSYSRLARIFKELMGIGIVEYVRNIKMEYAADLLKNSNKSVTEIIEEINYSSISYFNHTFKNTFGVTPTQMRYRLTEQKIPSDK